MKEKKNITQKKMREEEEMATKNGMDLDDKLEVEDQDMDQGMDKDVEMKEINGGYGESNEKLDIEKGE